MLTSTIVYLVYGTSKIFINGPIMRLPSVMCNKNNERNLKPLAKAAVCKSATSVLFLFVYKKLG